MPQGLNNDTSDYENDSLPRSRYYGSSSSRQSTPGPSATYHPFESTTRRPMTTEYTGKVCGSLQCIPSN